MSLQILKERLVLNSYNIPQTGDVVYVSSDYYTGYATVTYIDYPLLYVHHMYPIQVEIQPEDCIHKKFKDDHCIFRINLKEISQPKESAAEAETSEHNIIMENYQGTLFDF